MIGTFYDMQMMQFNVQMSYREFNYYAWPRLSIIAGYVLSGFIGAAKKHYHFNMCLSHVCMGSDIAYFDLTKNKSKEIMCYEKDSSKTTATADGIAMESHSCRTYPG